MVLNASAFPLPHADLQCFVQFINHIIAERRKIQQVGVVWWVRASTALCLFHM